MNSLAVGDARLHQIAKLIDGLGSLAADEFEAALPDLERFITVLDVLIERDDAWQRRLRREVIAAFSRLPKKANGAVPGKFHLRVLHACICEFGPKQAIESLGNEPCPSWIGLVRLYRPGYGEASESALARRERDSARRLHDHIDGRPYTVGELRVQLRNAERILDRHRRLLARCEVLNLHDMDPVPNDLLAAERVRWKRKATP